MNEIKQLNYELNNLKWWDKWNNKRIIDIIYFFGNEWIGWLIGWLVDWLIDWWYRALIIRLLIKLCGYKIGGAIK